MKKKCKTMTMNVYKGDENHRAQKRYTYKNGMGR